jgi:hypothetical protein
MGKAGNILWTILKIIFKILVILLWGVCRLSELILSQINVFLQYLVNKPYKTQFK